jgi:uncharacterized membrane protein
MGIKKVENGVTTSMLWITIFLSALVMVLVIPNIYLDNHIYYESREIAHLQAVKLTFEEEQKIIKNKLERINYEENLRKQDIK